MRCPTSPNHLPDWKADLAAAVTDLTELADHLGLPIEACGLSRSAAEAFSVLVPRPYLARIQPGDPHDPLLRQVLPVEREMDRLARFVDDPLDERDGRHGPGLLCKYGNRVLMVTTGACAVHCRFCFRRHYPHPSQGPYSRRVLWEAADRIARETSIHEVIFSGGDPWTLDDKVLGDVSQRLAEIRHLRRIRFHTRLPVMIPNRVTPELVRLLRATRLTASVVVHVNHPREIDAEVTAALARLVDGGVPVLSQTVLLRGVNDRLDVLVDLFEGLVDRRVTPYYLHQLDRVAGAAHFEVPDEEGIELVRRLRARLPGLAVPRYVREVPGEPNKVVLA